MDAIIIDSDCKELPILSQSSSNENGDPVVRVNTITDIHPVSSDALLELASSCHHSSGRPGFYCIDDPSLGERLWVGDLFAAIKVAMQQQQQQDAPVYLNTRADKKKHRAEVGSVINVSELEAFGMTLADNYYSKHITYSSLITSNGICFADAPPHSTAYLAFQLTFDNNVLPWRKVRIGNSNYRVHAYPISHKTLFIFNMFRAADMIDFILSNSKKCAANNCVLVHSMTGCNRAPACAVAYLVLKKNMPAAEAIALVRRAAKKQTGMDVLTNRYFDKMLLQLPGKYSRRMAEIAFNMFCFEMQVKMVDISAIAALQNIRFGDTTGYIHVPEVVYPTSINALAACVKRFTRENNVQKRCAWCGSMSFDLFMCSGCCIVLYCSRKCQKRDWARHSSECSHLQPAGRQASLANKE